MAHFSLSPAGQLLELLSSITTKSDYYNAQSQEMNPAEKQLQARFRDPIKHPELYPPYQEKKQN